VYRETNPHSLGVPNHEGEVIVEKLNRHTFYSFISAGDRVVEFSAQWCFDCKRLRLSLPELENRYASAFRFGELDVDEAREIAESLGVKGVPTFIVFRDGREWGRLPAKDARKEKNLTPFFDRMSYKSPA